MKTADEVFMVYVKEILPKTSCSKFILQNNGIESRNKQLMAIFDILGIKRIYSNPYYPRGNSRIGNVHNFLKQTMAKFMNDIAPSVDDLESPFYLVHSRDPLQEDSATSRTIANMSETNLANWQYKSSGRYGNSM